MFGVTHPLLTQGAGRIKTDPENEKRIATVLDRYEQWNASKPQSEQHQLTYTINRSQLERSRIVFPLAGFTIGVISSFSFVHPNSKYIGKFFTLLTTYLGYKLHKHYEQFYNSSRYFGNFAHYPKDIQRMIDNNDARYAFRWLRDDYLELEAQ